MKKFFLSFFAVFFIDQLLKQLFLHGFEWHSKCISLVLAINKGIAFSLLSFLGSNLKFIQLGIIILLAIFLYKEKIIKKHPIITGILLAAALSNLLDRFLIGGVVDYVYWHCGFKFAIFNFADVMIDFSILVFVYYYIFGKIPKSVA
ncbi:signal peptidase II [Caminibacter pacificus]|jgi:signal peptidase II|uniref:Lipoprotein signal peptidase n=1 Tax=Caminibacter pacificus TaxID=1424653 RepID=A0AAJ4REG1_9BACT|nr:signal peptidase II [Caminibacter pacificus]NPA87156.1 lipoprotein signal peptidase [Campylobacterota bacterium]QCI28126.1 lipoprotein signal peptidase [Caminibacter pacificus]ROR41163.1 signal peptidase II [Caminibacter pacificus]